MLVNGGLSGKESEKNLEANYRKKKQTHGQMSEKLSSPCSLIILILVNSPFKRNLCRNNTLRISEIGRYLPKRLYGLWDFITGNSCQLLNKIISNTSFNGKSCTCGSSCRALSFSACNFFF